MFNNKKNNEYINETIKRTCTTVNGNSKCEKKYNNKNVYIQGKTKMQIDNKSQINNRY